MKVTEKSRDLPPDAAYSERHVMLYPAAWEDPSPGTMEDIKISIVNDRATGLKRQREEITAVTPCSKKLCSVFSCSTPDSASFPSWSSPSTSKASSSTSKDSVKLSHISPPVVNSSEAAQERSSVAVTPFPRPAHRSFNFSSFQLECQKENYCHQVLMHIEDPERTNNLDPFHELASLLNQISRENLSWQHPSNFSRRNHPRRGRKPSTRYTLNEWVERNGGAVPRFTNIPLTFQRSPVPEALPFQFS